MAAGLVRMLRHGRRCSAPVGESRTLAPLVTLPPTFDHNGLRAGTRAWQAGGQPRRQRTPAGLGLGGAGAVQVINGSIKLARPSESAITGLPTGLDSHQRRSENEEQSNGHPVLLEEFTA